MYDIRQFHPTLYTVLLMALTGYGVALESPPHLVAGITLVVLHALLAIRGSTFKIPRYVASILALLSGLWSIVGLFQGTANPLLAVSQWLFVLVLVTLWSRSDNRAYGQMLVMSLVLMVAGAINSASLVYGLILIAYLFLTLYCCLLFHLKVEKEHATRAYNLTDNRPLPAALRHDQTYFNRSMRRLATLVSMVAITAGVLVFVFFPRAKMPQGLAMQFPNAQAPPVTGFSERMRFGQVAKITQNEQVVAHVTITEQGKPLPPSDIYLRGLALDTYMGQSNRSPQLSWLWIRNFDPDETERHHLASGVWRHLTAAPQGRQIHQTIMLQPTGVATLFALDGATALAAEGEFDVAYSPSDGAIQAAQAFQSAIRYEVISTGDPPPYHPSQPDTRSPVRPKGGSWPVIRPDPPLPTSSFIDPRVAAYAQRPDVSGTDANGPLASQRGNSPGPSPLDEKIATAIATHLQSDFQYTLDLSDTTRDLRQDPMALFLYDYKRGHCEYFAGAMTLMCQSLGMKARVVIGFHAGPGDFNSVGGYYVVRQSNAHAWVEVLTPQGWKSFDPTSGQFYRTRQPRGMFASLGDVFDYFQYKWATSVVTYDNRHISVWGDIQSGLATSVSRGRGIFSSIQDYLGSRQGRQLSTRLIAAGIAVSVIGLIVALILYMAERRRLNRRAQRIGLARCPLQIGFAWQDN